MKLDACDGVKLCVQFITRLAPQTDFIYSLVDGVDLEYTNLEIMEVYMYKCTSNLYDST